MARGRADVGAVVSFVGYCRDEGGKLAALELDTRLRDYDIPRDDLGELSAATAERGAAKSNPRPASPQQIQELFETVW